MNWKKVPKQDTSKNWLYQFQNFSDIPNSYVYIYIDTDGTGPTPEATPSHKLIAHQVLRVPINSGVTIYYAEDNGGIFVFSKSEKIPFKNFDVPVFHEDFILNNIHRFTAPAGSMIVFQNMDKNSDIFINIGGSEAGDGWFRCTSLATLWWAFAEDTPITVKGEKGTETVSIFQQRSLSVTELSEETQQLLEDIINRIALIESAMVRKEELAEVNKRTYYGLWSPWDDVNLISATSITTNPFESLVSKYRSKLFIPGLVIDAVSEFTLTYKDSSNIEQTETAYLQFRFKYTDNKTSELLEIDTGNIYLKEHLKSIKIDTNNTKDAIRFIFGFDTSVNNIRCKTTIRSEEMAIGIKDGQINPQSSTLYEFNLFNQGLIFTDDVFLLKMIEPLSIFGIPQNNILTYSVKTGADLVNNQPIDNYNVYNISRGNFAVKYYEPFDINSYPAYISIEVPNDFKFTSIIGFKLVPKEGVSPEPIVFNISAVLDKVQEYQIVQNKQHIRSYIVQSKIYNYSYMSSYKTITTDMLSKCNLEILYYSNKGVN